MSNCRFRGRCLEASFWVFRPPAPNPSHYQPLVDSSGLGAPFQMHAHRLYPGSNKSTYCCLMRLHERIGFVSKGDPEIVVLAGNQKDIETTFHIFHAAYVRGMSIQKLQLFSPSHFPDPLPNFSEKTLLNLTPHSNRCQAVAPHLDRPWSWRSPLQSLRWCCGRLGARAGGWRSSGRS